MADEQTDLLLKLASDVGEGIRGLQLTVLHLDQLNQTALATQRSLDHLNTRAATTEQSFSKLGAKIITVNQALELGKHIYHGVTGLLDTLVLSTLHEADALDRLSVRTGISASQLSSYSLGLRQANTDVGTLAVAVEQFERRLQSAAQRGGPFAKFIKDNFGRTPQQLLDEPDKLVERIAGVYAGAKPSQRSRFTQEAFGRGSRELGPFFAEGAEGIRKLQAETREAGGVLGDDFVKAAVKANKEIARLEETFKGIKNQIAQSIFPLFNKELTALTTWLRENQEAITSTATNWLTKAESALKRAAPLAETLATNLGKVASTALDDNSALGKIISFAAAHPGLAMAVFGVATGGPASPLAIAGYATMVGEGDVQAAGGAALDTARGYSQAFGMGVRGMTPAEHEVGQLELRAADLRAQIERSRGGALPVPARLRRDYQMAERRASQARAALRRGPSVSLEGGMSPVTGFGGVMGEGTGTQPYAEKPAGGGDIQFPDPSANAAAAAAIQSAAALANARVDIERTMWQSLLNLNQIQQVDFLRKEQEFALRRIEIQREALQKQLDLARSQGDKAQVEGLQGQLALIPLQIEQATEESRGAIAVAERDRADQVRGIQREVASLTNQAFASTTEGQHVAQLQQIGNAWVDMVEKVQRAGLPQYIDEVNAAYRQLKEDANKITINLGQTLRQGIQQSFAGVIAGTREPSELLEGLGQALTAKWADVLGSMLEEKLDFDLKLEKNFLKDIPELAGKGFTAVGQAFSNLASWLGGGSGTGPPVSVTPGSTSAPNVANLGGIVGGLVGAGTGAAAAAAETTPGLSTSVAGPPTAVVAAGIEAAAPPSGGGSSLTSGLAGIGTAVATYGASIILDIIGNVPGLKDFINKSANFRKNLSYKDIANYLGGGGIVGAIGALGEQFDPFDLLAPPTTGTQLATATEHLMTQAGLPQQRVFRAGGHSGIRARDLSRVPFVSTLGAFQAAGFGVNQEDLRQFGLTIEDLAQRRTDTSDTDQTYQTLSIIEGVLFGSPSGLVHFGRHTDNDIQSRTQLRDLLEAAAARHPEVEAMRTQENLGLGIVLGGNAERGVTIANELTNNLLLLGVGAGEAKRQMLKLAEAAGLNLASALEEVARIYAEGLFRDDDTTEINEEIQQVVTTIEGIVKLFAERIPIGIDVSALALGAFTEEAGVDVDKLLKRLEAAQVFSAGMKFGPAVTGSLTTGQAGTFKQLLQQSYAQTIPEMLGTAMTDNKAFQDIFAGVSTPIIEAAELFMSGDFAGANEKIRTAGEAMGSALDKGTEFIDMVLTATPEIQKIVDEIEAAADASAALQSALGAALQPLVNVDPQEEVSRTERIKSLEFAISRAKEFGDEIAAATLEMQLGTERAAQSMAGGAGTGARFLAELKSNVRQQVYEGIVTALIESEAMTDILQPIFAKVGAVTTDTLSDPAQLDAYLASVTGAWAAAGPAIDQLMTVIQGIAPLLGGLQTLDAGGVVRGRLGNAVPVIAHGGEMVLNTQQQQSMLAALGTSAPFMGGGSTGGIQVVVQIGHVIGNDLHNAAQELSEVMLEQLKLQFALPHYR